MEMTDIPFGTTSWAAVEPTEHRGDVGVATWRTQRFENIRVRMVEYSAGYVADHWCSKGHVLLCLEGELHTELDDGRNFVLYPGMSSTRLPTTPKRIARRRQRERNSLSLTSGNCNLANGHFCG
jgi:hypothetical protein